MSKSNYQENWALDASLGSGDPATYFVALSTADPGEAGAGIAEPAVGGYGRIAVTNNEANFPTAVGGSKSNAVEILFAIPTASWGLITDAALFDALTGGNLRYKGALTTPRTITAGDTVKFAAGALTFTED